MISVLRVDFGGRYAYAIAVDNAAARLHQSIPNRI
jgi:hypothetical protein